MNCDRTKFLRKALLFLLKLTVSAVFIWFVLSRIDITVLKDRVGGARISHLIMAALVLVCGGFAGAASWYNVIRSSSVQISYARVAAMHWSGMLFNSFLPSNIGGDFYKGWMLVKDQEPGVAKVIAGIIVDRMLNFSILLLIGLVSLSLYCGKIAMVAAVITSALFLLAFLSYTAKKWPRREGGGKLLNFAQSTFDLFRNHNRCASALFAATLSQGCKIGCHIFLISALGLSIDPQSVWHIIPLFGIISALPISLGGLGLRESVAMWIASPAGAGSDEMVVFSLVSHALFIAVNFLGLIPLLLHRNKTATAAPPSA